MATRNCVISTATGAASQFEQDLLLLRRRGESTRFVVGENGVQHPLRIFTYVHQIQFLGIDASSVPIDGLVPGIGANFGGDITVGLKPGIINLVPVTKKAFKGPAPWVKISNFRVKIDGCVGQSFIRSYAVLTKSTDAGDAILSWYGTTTVV